MNEARRDNTCPSSSIGVRSSQRGTILDEEGRKTTVWISNAEFGMALNPKLFHYQSPYASPTPTENPE